MPTVPIAPRVNPAPIPGVRVGGGAPAAAFGGVNPGLDLSAPQQLAARIGQEEKVKADQIALTDAGAQTSAVKTQTLTSVLNRRGKDAFGAPEDARAAWDAATQNIRANLGNDDQRLAFDRLAANEWAQADEQIQRHVARERQSYDTDTTDAFVANKGQEALIGYQDPGISAAAIVAQRAAVADYGKRNGWSDDQIAQQVGKTISATHYGIFERLQNEEQDAAATKYFQDHRTEFVGKDLLQAEKLADLGSVRAESQRQADLIVTGRVPGQIAAGNIDLAHRPRVTNADGSVSTVRSISIGEDGHEVLIPTVSDDGRILSDDEAVALYRKTGRHLGVFANEASANQYAQQIHEAQSALLDGRGNGAPPAAAVTLTDAIARTAAIADPRVRDAAEARVRRHFADRAADERQEREDAWTQASGIVEQSQDASKIPLSLRVKLSPEQNEALDHRSQQLRYPKVETNVSLYSHLINMAGLNDSTRTAFSQLDLTNEQYRSSLSDADYRHVLALQREIRSSSERTTARADDAVRRREETGVLKQSDNAQKQAASRAQLEKMAPGAGKYIPPPAKVVVPQWMLDSARTTPDYAEYLKLHGVKVDAAPAAVPVSPPRVPGAPLSTPQVSQRP